MFENEEEERKSSLESHEKKIFECTENRLLYIKVYVKIENVIAFWIINNKITENTFRFFYKRKKSASSEKRH